MYLCLISIVAGINNDISRYAGAHSSLPSSILNNIERQTYATEVLPHMISSRHTGRFLSMLSAIIKPEHILEIGTFTGYGTMCLAEGLAAGGKIITIESNPEVAVKAQRHFEEAGLKEIIELYVGDAMEIIENLKGTFDIIFLDADKKRYAEYYTRLLPLLKPNGLLIADNVLWYGKVIEPGDDKDAQALDGFNKMVVHDAATHNVLVTMDDGLMLIRKHT